MRIACILTLSFLLVACGDNGQRDALPAKIFMPDTRVTEPEPAQAQTEVEVVAEDPTPPMTRAEEHRIAGETLVERAQELISTLAEPTEGMLFVYHMDDSPSTARWAIVGNLLTTRDPATETDKLSGICIYYSNKSNVCGSGNTVDNVIAMLIQDLSRAKTVEHYTPTLASGDVVDLADTAIEERIQTLFFALQHPKAIIQTGKKSLLVGGLQLDATAKKALRCVHTLGSTETNCATNIEHAVEFGKRSDVTILMP